MSEVDETTWRREQFGTGKQETLPGILAAAKAPTWSEAQEEQAARAAVAAAAEKREKIAALDAANDHPMAKRAALQAEAGESRVRIADLAEQLSRARQDAERIEANLAYYDRMVGEIQAAAAPPPSDDPIEQANRMAHETFKAVTRAKIAELQAGTPRRAPRPPSISRGAEVHRSEYCQHCIDQNVSDEDSYLLHSDPELQVPVTSPEQAAQQQAEHAERRGYSYAGEISR